MEVMPTMAVALVQLHQAHALGGAALLGDALARVFFLDRGAGDDAVGGDEHDLALFVHHAGGHHRAGLVGGAEGAHARAGAVLVGVLSRLVILPKPRMVATSR